MTDPTLIEPRTLPGFRDYPPEAMIPRERLIETARTVYRSYGFSPIDTPALEYLEILAGKGSEETDRQLYKFRHGDKDMALRFDLTVPLARFAAEHIAQLGTPFKRYHIATVWRGERHQRGRYREFMQCDFDTIGTRSSSADIETALVIFDLFNAIGFEKQFTIRVNHRLVLNGLLARCGLEHQATAILRAIDKLPKIGREKVAEEMQAAAGASQEQADQVLALSELSGTNEEILSQLERLVAGSEKGEAGVARLRELVAATRAVGVPAEQLEIDVSIARGLDYYTGTVYETFLRELPGIGSVCSGGRYDNLAGLYTRQELPGVGASLGLDRLLAAMEELGRLKKVSTPAQVFIPYFDKDRLHEYLTLAARLRRAGFGVEVYPEAKRLGDQLKYADRRGFHLALVVGSNEFVEQKCQIKDLVGRATRTVSLAAESGELIEAVREMLVGGS